MHYTRMFRFLSGIGIILGVAANARESDNPMRFLIDGTQSNRPFRILYELDESEHVPAAAHSAAVIHKDAKNGKTWNLYIIEYSEETLARILTICTLHRNANELSDRYSQTMAEIEQARRQTTSSPRARGRMTELQKAMTQLQDILSQSQAERKKADQQAMELFRSCGKIKLFKVDAEDVIVSFSGKKIFFALEATDRGKYVNTWHKVFDAAQKNEEWTLK